MSENVSKLAVKIAETLKTARQETRKQITKRLQKSREAYSKLHVNVSQKERELHRLERELASAKAQLDSCTEEVHRCYELLKNMDLADANEVRFHNDGIGYIRNDKKEYHIEVDNGKIVLIPMNKHKASKRDKGKEDTGDLDDSLDLEGFDLDEAE